MTAEPAAHVALPDPADLWVDAKRLGTDVRTAGSARGRATIRTADRRDIVMMNSRYLYAERVAVDLQVGHGVVASTVGR
jgi:hypothetical protein